MFRLHGEITKEKEKEEEGNKIKKRGYVILREEEDVNRIAQFLKILDTLYMVLGMQPGKGTTGTKLKEKKMKENERK